MLLAVGLESMLQELLIELSALLVSPFSDFLGVPGLPTFFIFTGIYLAFNKFAWRWPVIHKFVAQPDLNGTWNGELESSYHSPDQCDTTETTKTDGGDLQSPRITIDQTWSHLELILETENSISESTSATFRTSKSSPELVLTYVNKPKGKPATELNMHEGTNLLRVVTDVNNKITLEGTYYTDEQRNNHGTMSFTRSKN